MNAKITALHVYPLKSCRGIAQTTALLTARGLAHDREWMLVDANGQFLTQRTVPCMAQIGTKITGEVLCLQVPGRAEVLEIALAAHDRPLRRVRVWSDDCDALGEGNSAARWISEFLGVKARLVRFDPSQRRLSQREWTGPVEAENRFSDGFPVLVIGEESLEDLNSRLDAALPMDRFRPNIVVRGLGSHGEDSAAVLNGDGFEIRLVKPCVRCSITTKDQATGESTGKEPLRTLAKYRHDPMLGGVTFGMNGIVTARADVAVAVGMPLIAEG